MSERVLIPGTSLQRLPTSKRGTRPQDPEFIIWHATRGDPKGDQYLGTINWFTMTGNNAAADCVVAADGRMTHFTDLSVGSHGEYPMWSAGRGNWSTFPADERGYSVEVAQSWALEDYTDAQVAKCAEIALACKRRWGIPFEPIAFLHQNPNLRPPQRGHAYHQNSANGVWYGKTDPGTKFPLSRILAAARALEEASTPKSPPKEKPVAKLTPDQQYVVDQIRATPGLTDAQVKAALASVGLDAMPGEEPATPPPPAPPASGGPTRAQLEEVEALAGQAATELLRLKATVDELRVKTARLT